MPAISYPCSIAFSVSAVRYAFNTSKTRKRIIAGLLLSTARASAALEFVPPKC